MHGRYVLQVSHVDGLHMLKGAGQGRVELDWESKGSVEKGWRNHPGKDNDAGLGSLMVFNFLPL